MPLAALRGCCKHLLSIAQTARRTQTPQTPIGRPRVGCCHLAQLRDAPPPPPPRCAPPSRTERPRQRLRLRERRGARSSASSVCAPALCGGCPSRRRHQGRRLQTHVAVEALPLLVLGKLVAVHEEGPLAPAPQRRARASATAGPQGGRRHRCARGHAPDEAARITYLLHRRPHLRQARECLRRLPIEPVHSRSGRGAPSSRRTLGPLSQRPGSV